MRHKTLKLSILIAISMTLAFQATSAIADWRSEIGVFRVGVLSQSQLQGFPERAEPFRLALAETLEMDVEFFPVRNSQSLIEAMTSGRIEYAIMPATVYALTWVSCECVEPMVTAKSFDGTDGYHTILISGPNAPASLSELGDEPIASLSSKSLSQTALLKASISVEPNVAELPDADKALSAFATDQYRLLLGWSSLNGDASVGYSRGSLRQLREMGLRSLSDYKIIWKSDQIPHSTHVVRSKLPAEPKNLIKNLLLNLYERNPIAYDSIEPFHAGGFNTSRHSRFKSLVDLVQSMKPVEIDSSASE